MGLEALFNPKEIAKELDKFAKRAEDEVANIFFDIGKKAVKEQRVKKQYQNRSMNLINSTGCVVSINGRVLRTYFPIDGRGEEYPDPRNESGEKVGKQLARDIAHQYKKGIVLVLVAGMHYASYVEDIHHLSVLQDGINSVRKNSKTIKDKLMAKLNKKV